MWCGAGSFASAHDISEGGLACALAECCIEGGIGARIELPFADDAALFGEGPGGVVSRAARRPLRRCPGPS